MTHRRVSGDTSVGFVNKDNGPTKTLQSAWTSWLACQNNYLASSNNYFKFKVSAEHRRQGASQ
jgi:hypothetical protein